MLRIKLLSDWYIKSVFVYLILKKKKNKKERRLFFANSQIMQVCRWSPRQIKRKQTNNTMHTTSLWRMLLKLSKRDKTSGRYLNYQLSLDGQPVPVITKQNALPHPPPTLPNCISASDFTEM